MNECWQAHAFSVCSLYRYRVGDSSLLNLAMGALNIQQTFYRDFGQNAVGSAIRYIKSDRVILNRSQSHRQVIVEILRLGEVVILDGLAASGLKRTCVVSD